MTARRLFYEGRVQGVGFRYTVKRIAAGFDIVGSIRNHPDGRVELQAGGDSTELEAFLLAIRESELNSFIKAVQEHPIPPLTNAKGFEIEF